LIALAGIAAAAAPALAEIELKAASALATNREQAQGFIRFFVGTLNQQGKGVLRFHFLGGPEVMPPSKQAQAVGRGALDVAMSPASYYAGNVPEANLVVVSERTPGELRKNGGFALLDAAHQKKLNAKLLAWGDSGGAFNTYLSQKPPMTADGGIDLKGFKLRSTATYRPLFNFLGGTSISMPSGDIYTGLQRGVIQGFGTPSSGLVALGVKGLAKYRIDPSFYRINNFVLMNVDRWKALPQGAKDLLERVAMSYEVESSKFYLAAAAVDEKEMKSAGMQVVTLKGEAAKKYLAAANNGMIERISKQAGAASVDALLAKMRK
jgi:TRAP-type C4-dicarboxylate transport system substrate-binding protein